MSEASDRAAIERVFAVINESQDMPVEIKLTIPERIFDEINDKFGMKADPLLWVPLDAGKQDGYVDVIAYDAADARVLRITANPDGTVDSFWLAEGNWE